MTALPDDVPRRSPQLRPAEESPGYEPPDMLADEWADAFGQPLTQKAWIQAVADADVLADDDHLIDAVVEVLSRRDHTAKLLAETLAHHIGRR